MKIKNIEKVIMGYFEIETWYYSPYPKEFLTKNELYICDFCLKYMNHKETLIKHYVILIT